MAETIEGELNIQDETSRSTHILLNGNTASVVIGDNGRSGRLFIRDSNGQHILMVHATTFTVGTAEKPATLDIRDTNNRQAFVLDSRNHRLEIRDENNYLALSFKAENGELKVGNTNHPGRIYLLGERGKVGIELKCEGIGASLEIGKDEHNGGLRIFDRDGACTFQFLGANGQMSILGGRGREKRRVISFLGTDASLRMGGGGVGGDIYLEDDHGNERIRLSGTIGDIRLSGADCAELFVVDAPAVEPGSVVVIGDNENLQLSEKPYDPRVAGIISGANGLTPGVLLGMNGKKGLYPISLSGKVYCKVVAGEHSIGVGDFLTTSGVVGHAMKVVDKARAFGASIGKALRATSKDSDLIPVLVSLR
jgi:hypothetical protein